ncbi:MAG: hypothetical protein FJ104_01855 [Deltaproteobacteria bacterium]|nr:hypothetical protein [Deltaproteobacteria bacterium]
MTIRGAAAALLAVACSRDLELADDPTGSFVVVGVPEPPEGGVPEVERAAFTDPALLACAARPTEPGCVGINDYPCDLAGWVPRLVEECEAGSGCTGRGFLSIELGEQGCAVAVGMTDPEAALLACVVERLRTVQCPCTATEVVEFLGASTERCGPPPVGPKG